MAGVSGYQSHFWQRNHILSSVVTGYLVLVSGRGLSPTCVQMATIFCHRWDQYCCPWGETSVLSHDPSYMLSWESLVQLHVAKAMFCCLVHCEWKTPVALEAHDCHVTVFWLSHAQYHLQFHTLLYQGNAALLAKCVPQNQIPLAFESAEGVPLCHGDN